MPKKKQKDYDSEPVTYCAKCYSLKIFYEETVGMDCCKDCGCTDLKTSSFEEWEKLYNGRYGHKFLEAKGSIKRNPIFQMNMDKLKGEVFKNTAWKEICRKLYPAFPQWLSKADSIILLFAKLYQDNRMDELRTILVKQN